MHYFQQPNNKIQADIARRIKIIALQYSRYPKKDEEDFSGTLHLCLLQSLLTNCYELLDDMKRQEEWDLGLNVPLNKKFDWSLDEVEIRMNTFNGELTVAEFIKHLRNAMSHPTGTNLDSEFPSTGYNSIQNDFRHISGIGFCDSPDTIFNSQRFWTNSDALLKSQIQSSKE